MANDYPYAPRHNPFVYFNDVNGSSVCAAHVHRFTDLTTGLNKGSVARYNFIVPNLCDDMHDSCAPTDNAVRQGDDWLSRVVSQITSSTAYADGGALFITWDEGERSRSDGPIGMIVVSPLARGSGYSNSISYTHSSFLRTLEEIFGVSPMLGHAASTSTDLSDLLTTFP